MIAMILVGYNKGNRHTLLHKKPKEVRIFDAATPVQSDLLKDIQRLKESHDGGDKDSSVNVSKDFQEKVLSLLDSSDWADELYASQKV